MFERFSEQARRAVYSALKEARRLGFQAHRYGTSSARSLARRCERCGASRHGCGGDDSQWVGGSGSSEGRAHRPSGDLPLSEKSGSRL